MMSRSTLSTTSVSYTPLEIRHAGDTQQRPTPPPATPRLRVPAAAADRPFAVCCLLWPRQRLRRLWSALPRGAAPPPLPVLSTLSKDDFEFDCDGLDRHATGLGGGKRDLAHRLYFGRRGFAIHVPQML